MENQSNENFSNGEQFDFKLFTNSRFDHLHRPWGDQYSERQCLALKPGQAAGKRKSLNAAPGTR